jgi:hypothetical protein
MEGEVGSTPKGDMNRTRGGLDHCSCNDSLSPPELSKLMRWGREKPKGFIDEAPSFSVVSEMHAKLLSCRVDQIQIGNPCYCQEVDKRAVL